ncbi:MAG: SH3 domain-containing protein, partial [Flavobacteriaceae bacterium]
MFGICNLAIVPIRLESNHRSEMVSQLLFGEHFQILEQSKGWVKIKLHFDGYEGWIDDKQYQPISESEFGLLSAKEIVLNADLIEYISGKDNLLFPIPLGASLSFL